MRYRFLHIVLAALVYLSSLGVVLHGHYCREELRNLSVYWPAENCHAQAMPVDCPMHGSEMPAGQDDNDCCEDRADYLKDVQEAAPEIASLLGTLQISAILPAIVLPTPPSADRRSIDYLHYKPPLIVCDRSVVLQTFLC